MKERQKKEVKDERKETDNQKEEKERQEKWKRGGGKEKSLQYEKEIKSDRKRRMKKD